MKAAIALTVLVAAAMPAWADSDPVSPVDALSTNTCPVVIGTVTSMDTDPTRFGVTVTLDHILPASGVSRWVRDGIIKAVIPTSNVKSYPGLETYVGQEVALWPYPPTSSRVPGLPPIGLPNQLQLLSTAMADPKKTWCYLPALNKRYN